MNYSQKSPSENSEEKSEESSQNKSSLKGEEKIKKEVSEELKQNLMKNDAQKKLSEASFEESSIEEHNEVHLEEEEEIDYNENMPRLNENEVVLKNSGVIARNKPKKKKRKIKFKRGNKQSHQEMDIMMREQANKKDKAALAKASKSKKSYHAYLEHPRLRHQPSYQSPRRQKMEEDNEMGLASRPKKK